VRDDDGLGDHGNDNGDGKKALDLESILSVELTGFVDRLKVIGK
jgi:hypothetical protein